MALFNSATVRILVAAVLCIGYVQSKPSLSPFGKKVKSIIPNDTYNKIFAVNAKNEDQLMKGLQKGVEKVQEVFGIQFNQSILEQFKSTIKQLGLNKIDSSFLFHIDTNAVAKTLKQKGILNSDNMDDLAQKLVNNLKKKAMSLNSESVQSTFPALTVAIFKFLKSAGVTNKGLENQFLQNYLDEAKKYLD